jgi:hypothetical protein
VSRRSRGCVVHATQAGPVVQLRREAVHDAGQVSKLLARLKRLGLLVNGSGGHARDEPNAWALSERGRRVTESIRLHAVDDRVAA